MTRKIEIKWGIVFTLMMLLWRALEKVFGLHDSQIELHLIVSNFVMIPAILIYVLALKDKKKKDFDGVMSYKASVISGFILTAVITLLSPLSQYITVEYITPTYFENNIAYSVSHNLMTLEEANSYFNLKSFLMQTVVFTPFMGLVTTLVVSVFVFTRKKN